MARSKALSNRQRKAQRRLTPKAAIQHADAVVLKATPSMGVVAEATELMALQAEEARRCVAAIAVAAQEGAAVGPDGPVDMRGDLPGRCGVEAVTSKEVPGAPGNPLRARSRDGLLSMLASGSLTPLQVKAGLAYRLCYEGATKGLGSGLGNAGQPGGSRSASSLLSRSGADLHRAYLMARLKAAELAVADVIVDGRELHALRMIAGEARTVLEVAGNRGHARAMTRAALARALDAVAGGLRITVS